MKAILVNDDSKRSLRWDDVPNPVIKADEVLVKIHAAALNRADLLQRQYKQRQNLLRLTVRQR